MLRRDEARFEDRILGDVSAGVGDYTLSYARHFKWVLHCDLSIDALRYALARSRRMGLQNVFFLRVDYFALPFRDRKSTRLNSSHGYISYAVFCLKKKKQTAYTYLSHILTSLRQVDSLW